MAPHAESPPNELTFELPPLEKSDRVTEHPYSSILKAELQPKVKPRAPLRTIWPYLEIEEHPIDRVTPLRVVVVGAGISGITAGILLPQKVPGIDLKIYEKTSDIGGTWNTNIYPGVKCDIPADVYQSTFAPSLDWSTPYAGGAEIKAYWKSIVAEYDVEKYITFNSLINQAIWSHEKAKWLVYVDIDGVSHIDEADFLVTATGHFAQPLLPNYPGIEEYTGHLRHSSNWDPNFDPTGKKLALIGNGASGLQVLPQLQKVVGHLDHYARNPTWIAGSFGGEDSDGLLAKERPPQSRNAREYHEYRKEFEGQFWNRFSGMIKDGEKNIALKESFKKLMARRLDGIQTKDGIHREVDAIICSTGADISFSTAFPIIANGVDLQTAWRTGGNSGFPDSYLSIAAPGFPNMFIVLGPNSTGQAGTLPHAVETQITYIAKVLRKVSTQGIKTIAPTQAATNDFRAYCESFFPRTVMSEQCSSWYNGGIVGGRVHGVWPGSGTHVSIARREVRWEDFEYTYHNKSGNRFAYFGNGFSRKDEIAAENPDADVDFTPYLKKEAVEHKVDLRAHHELWFEV
ncbi:hypothetical protein B0O99DRAFT_737599 [Bisporella sp. PMI_857]|nr:hypothetical protein B0O99DRAFT_737599 [Bisporella sp. PMI_857]